MAVLLKEKKERERKKQKQGEVTCFKEDNIDQLMNSWVDERIVFTRTESRYQNTWFQVRWCIIHLSRGNVKGVAFKTY